MSDPVVKSVVTPPRQDWLADIGYYDDEKENKFIRALILGPSSVGKTHLIGTFPKPFVIDTDKGGMTLRKSHVPHVKCYESRGIIKKVFDWIDLALLKKGPFAPNGELADRETFALDSISVFSNSASNDLLMGQGKDPVKGDKMERDDYGRILAIFIELGKRMRRLSDMYNVIVTANMDTYVDDVTKNVTMNPLLVGSYRNSLCGDYDEVYLLSAKKTQESSKYFAYTGLYQGFMAKSRLNLPYCIEDPSYEKIKAGMK